MNDSRFKFLIILILFAFSGSVFTQSGSFTVDVTMSPSFQSTEHCFTDTTGFEEVSYNVRCLFGAISATPGTIITGCTLHVNIDLQLSVIFVLIMFRSLIFGRYPDMTACVRLHLTFLFCRRGL